MFIQDIENKISSGIQIVIDVPENLLHIRQGHNVVQRVSGAGHQIEPPLRPVGDHIRHIIGNLRIPLPGNLNHSCGKVHSRCFNAIAMENLAENSRAAGQIHGGFRFQPVAPEPAEQLLTEGLRVVVPPKFVIYLAEYLAVHFPSPRSFLHYTTVFHFYKSLI